MYLMSVLPFYPISVRLAFDSISYTRYVQLHAQSMWMTKWVHASKYQWPNHWIVVYISKTCQVIYGLRSSLALLYTQTCHHSIISWINLISILLLCERTEHWEEQHNRALHQQVSNKFVFGWVHICLNQEDFGIQ